MYMHRHLWWRIHSASHFNRYFTPASQKEVFRHQEGNVLLTRNKRVASNACNLKQYLFWKTAQLNDQREEMENRRQNSTWGNTLVTSSNVIEKSSKALSTRYFTHAKDSTFISIKTFLPLMEEIKAICQLNLFFQSYSAAAKPYYSFSC